jgi:hypothetical protein
MNKIEILLFYIADKNSQIESVLSGFERNREVAPELMLKLCVKFFAKHHPNADIYLITNNETHIHLGIPGLQVIRTDAISHEKIIFDLSVFRKAYLESKINQAVDIIFTDIDGTRYYQDERGDIVSKDGSLVTLTEEDNIRAWLRIMKGQSHD